jgi:thiol-disulfide isomerase/thioredoxin
MTITQLTTEHFRIAEVRSQRDGTSGIKKILTLQIKEPTLVYFYSPNCPHCTTTMPVIFRIAENTAIFRVCTMNIGTNRNVSVASRETTTPVTAVPLLIAYNGGRPVSIFRGDRTYDRILDFLVSVKTELEKEGRSTAINFVNRASPSAGRQGKSGEQKYEEHDIAEFKQDLGVPYNLVCDKDMCYLQFGQAFGETNVNQVPESRYMDMQHCYGGKCLISATNVPVPQPSYNGFRE